MTTPPRTTATLLLRSGSRSRGYQLGGVANQIFVLQWFGHPKDSPELVTRTETKEARVKNLSIAGVMATALFIGWTPASHSAENTSAYAQLSSDKYVSGAPQTVLTRTVNASKPGWLYVQSDGRLFPAGPALVSAAIFVNGEKISNDSVQDWKGSTNPQQRSYNIIGAKYVPAGTHTISLVALTTNGAAYFGSQSNLSVMLDAADNIQNIALPSDTAQFNFNTVGVLESSPLPVAARSQVLNANITSTGQPIVAFASGRSYVYGGYGDPMWGIFVNGQEPNISTMTWTINDMWKGAELQAPMFSQGLFELPSGNHSISLQASESPYNNGLTNNVKYKIGSNTRLITLTGGMNVVGKGLNSNTSHYGPYKRYAYVCIGTSFNVAGCPAAGTEVVLGEGIIDIPANHNGVVLLAAKSRVQGDSTDFGGTVELYIKIDGVRVGSWGVQQLAYPDSVSTRTITASYLAAGADALAPGAHLVEVIGRAVGSFQHLSMNADLPVLWFD